MSKKKTPSRTVPRDRYQFVFVVTELDAPSAVNVFVYHSRPSAEAKVFALAKANGYDPVADGTGQPTLRGAHEWMEDRCRGTLIERKPVLS